MLHSVKVGRLAPLASGALGFGRVCGSDVAKAPPGCALQRGGPQARSCHTGEETVVIRVPRYVQQRVDKVKQPRGKLKISTVKAGKLLIRSKNPVLNQSAGYTLGKFEEPVLCSRGWKHSKSFGDYFVINNTRSVAPYMRESQNEDSSGTFAKLSVNKELIETLGSMGITSPTTVQRLTIPKVMRGHNVLFAAETGSGKTLSYLLPIVQKVRAVKQSPDDGGGAPNFRSLILVPSRELAEQVASVARTLCAPFGLVTQTVGGGRGVGHVKAVFRREPADVLVATPGALVKALQRRYLDLSRLNFFVVDEADTMFDPSFSDLLEKILLHANISRSPQETHGVDAKAQLLVVGATFPGGVGQLLGQVTDLGAMVVIKSKMLHCLMPHVKQTFLKVKGADKILELQQALKLLHKDGGGGAAAALVFCNKSATVNWLGHALDEMGVRHARLQGDMPAAVRTGIFRSFQKGAADVLLCTDIASRGLDTSRVRLVVNYDFPESHADYIHRAGRVGRAGGAQEAEVLSFVTHPWNVELVQKIETAARRNTTLPGMESQIREPKPLEAETPE